MTQRFRRVASLLAAAAGAWFGASCGSSSISTTAPSSSKCQVAVTSSLSSAPSAGGSGTATVSTTRDCSWTAASTTSWLSIASGASGQGDGTIAFRVGANTDPTPRRGSLAVNDASLEIAQDAAPCEFTVTPPTSDVGTAGGDVRISVGASSPACTWTAVSNASWIVVREGASARGTGAATVNVAANTGGAREGSVVVAGKTVVLRQATAACSFSIAPASASVPFAGGAGTVTVTMLTGATCPWTATSDQTWLSVTTGASGTGSGTMAFAAAPNASAARSATITVAGKPFTVAQDAAPCTYTIAPPSSVVPAAGGQGTFNVAAHAACPWTAVAGADWIAVTSGGTGDGAGTVGFSVAANPLSAARTGTITAAGQTFTITQPAPCFYSVTPPTQPVPIGGGAVSFTVSTGPACSWTARSNVPWITIAAADSGVGTAAVGFVAAANVSTVPRSGTVTIGGQTVTVTQDGTPCTYTISPTTQTVGFFGGDGTITITTSDQSCRWTAASNNPDWLSITSPAAGTGNGTVTFAAGANPTPLVPRSGSLTVAAQPFTVFQP